MRAGPMDRRISLQSFALGSTGDPTAGTWTTESTTWAERMDPAGVERSVGSMVQMGEATQAYRIRYRSDVAPDPTWRVVDGTELWDVTAVLPGKGRDTERVLLVKRRDPDDES